MSLLPDRSRGAEPEEARATLHVDGEHDAVHRRAVFVARWRAAAIAERCFGTPLGHRLIGTARANGFRGLLEFEVPFEALAAHREAEAAFLAEVRRDEILRAVPFLFVFTPCESEVSRGA